MRPNVVRLTLHQDDFPTVAVTTMERDDYVTS